MVHRAEQSPGDFTLSLITVDLLGSIPLGHRHRDPRPGDGSTIVERRTQLDLYGDHGHDSLGCTASRRFPEIISSGQFQLTTSSAREKYWIRW
jgi:hypothetical protein